MKAGRPRMVGRQKELEELTKMLSQGLLGHGTLSLISGEAGIGKTKLVEEAQDIALSEGYLGLIGKCIPGATNPYLPFLEAFREFMDGNGQAPSTTVTSPFSKVSLSIGFTKESSESLFLRTFDFLRVISDSKPILLCLEDLHWIDSASAQLLVFLARKLSRMRVVILATFRPEELFDSQSGRGSPFFEALTQMRTEHLVHEISIHELDIVDLERMLELVLGDPIEKRLANRIAIDSEGNPLYAIEMLRLMISTEMMVFECGIWTGLLDQTHSAPATIKEVILRRIERLNRLERRCVDFASVIGESFKLQLMQRLVKREGAQIEELLTCLEDNHRIFKAVDDEYYFQHDMMRAVVYEDISNTKKEEMHRLVGELIEKDHLHEYGYGALSFHFERGKKLEKCLKYSMLAAGHCMASSAFLEAAVYFEKVVRISDQLGSFETEAISAMEGLGDAHTELLDYEKSYAYYERLATIVATENDLARIYRKSAECWMAQKLGKGSWGRYRELLSKASEYRDVNKFERGEIVSNFAAQAHLKGEFAEADRKSREAMELFKESGALQRLAWELILHSYNLIALERPREALDELREAGDILLEYPWPRAETMMLNTLGIANLIIGEYEKSMRAFGRSLELSEKLENYYEQAWSNYYLGLINYLAGELVDARDRAESGRASASRYEYPNLLAMPTLVLIGVNLEEGRGDDARLLLGQVIDSVYVEKELRTPLWGLMKVMCARIALMKELEEPPDGLFSEGLDLLKGAQNGSFYEAVSRMWYGRDLMKHGFLEAGKSQLTMSSSLFGKIGNNDLAIVASTLSMNDTTGR